MAFARDVNFWSLHPSKKTNYRLVIRRFVLIRRLFFRRLSPVEIFFFFGSQRERCHATPKSPVVLFSINWDKCSAHWPDPLAFASINTSRRRSFVYQRHLLRGGSGRSGDGKCHGPLTMSRWKMSRLLNVNKVLVQWMGGVPLTPQSRLQLEEKVTPVAAMKQLGGLTTTTTAWNCIAPERQSARIMSAFAYLALCSLALRWPRERVVSVSHEAKCTCLAVP